LKFSRRTSALLTDQEEGLALAAYKMLKLLFPESSTWASIVGAVQRITP